MNKRVNQVEQYKAILHNLRKRGISYSLNFIFGWDMENVNVFSNTLRFLQDEKVPVAYFNILTPHRGTPLYTRMMEEGRILNAYHIEDGLALSVTLCQSTVPRKNLRNT